MKRLIVLTVVLFMALSLGAQPQFWGKDRNTVIIWANTFRTGADGTLDSLEFVNPDYYKRTLFFTNETLYTQILPMDALNTEGIGKVSFSLDTSGLYSDAIPDSIILKVRLYYDKNIHESPWSLWRQIGGYHSAETNNPYEYEIADSSFWGPANGVQFMCDFVDADADTIKAPNLGYYNK